MFLDFFVLKGFSIRSRRFPYVDPFQDIIPAVLLTSGKSAADTSGDAVRQGGETSGIFQRIQGKLMASGTQFGGIDVWYCAYLCLIYILIITIIIRLFSGGERHYISMAFSSNTT